MQLIHQEFVTVAVVYLLFGPFRERMRRGRNDRHSLLLRQAGNYASKCRNVFAGFLNIGTNARSDLDHRLDHLWLYLFAEQKLAFFEDLGNMRFQLARFRVDDLKLLFDPESELVEHTG